MCSVCRHAGATAGGNISKDRAGNTEAPVKGNTLSVQRCVNAPTTAKTITNNYYILQPVSIQTQQYITLGLKMFMMILFALIILFFEHKLWIKKKNEYCSNIVILIILQCNKNDKNTWKEKKNSPKCDIDIMTDNMCWNLRVINECKVLPQTGRVQQSKN